MRNPTPVTTSSMMQVRGSIEKGEIDREITAEDPLIGDDFAGGSGFENVGEDRERAQERQQHGPPCQPVGQIVRVPVSEQTVQRTAISGNSGMSLMIRSMESDTLPLQQIHFIDIGGNFAAKDDDNDGETDGGFTGRNGDDEQRDDLSCHGVQVMGKCDQIDVRRVQHDFDGHQYNNEISTDQYAEQARCE